MEILSSEGIAKAINEACSSTTQNFFQNGKSCPAAKDLILRRGQPQDVPQILQCLKEGEILPTNPLHPPEKTNISEWSEEACRLDGVPNFFGLVLQQKSGTASGSCCGLVTFHFAYSTWDGRVLYLDRMILPTLDDTKALEFSVQYTLVEIAIRLSCARYTWQHTLPLPTFPGDVQPEYLEGWLTLNQEQEMADSSSKAGPWSTESDRAAIIDCLEKLEKEEQQQQGAFRLRLSTADDLQHIERLVHGLALYEKEPESVHVTAEHYRHDGFTKDQPPLFHCILLEDTTGVKPYVCGMAFCFFGYTFGEGRFLYLEDLFIEKEYRGKGGGALAMNTLSKVARSLQCARMIWQVLDWNTPALNLYDKLGGKVQDGLLTSRFAGDEHLQKFYQGRTSY